jgi:hypothetical protein
MNGMNLQTNKINDMMYGNKVGATSPGIARPLTGCSVVTVLRSVRSQRRDLLLGDGTFVLVAFRALVAVASPL